MTESMVQVPVSLIERARVAVDNADAWRVVSDVRALLSQPTQIDERATSAICPAETHSWDHYRAEQIDSYWIRCTEQQGHGEEHHDSNTGLRWFDPSTIRDVTPPKDVTA